MSDVPDHKEIARRLREWAFRMDLSGEIIAESALPMSGAKARKAAAEMKELVAILDSPSDKGESK